MCKTKYFKIVFILNASTIYYFSADPDKVSEMKF